MLPFKKTKHHKQIKILTSEELLIAILLVAAITTEHVPEN